MLVGKLGHGVLLLLVGALVAACSAAQPNLSENASVTFTPARSALASASPALTRTDTPSPAPSATVVSNTPTATATATPALSPTSAPATDTPESIPTATSTPWPTPDGVTRSVHVPILMYHYVSEPPPGSNVYRKDLSVSPMRFAEHLSMLRDSGYTTISLDDLLYALVQGAPIPDKPVVLTFDDGYVDNYTNAFPLLAQMEMVGNFFILTDFVSQSRAEYMSWPQIEEMAAAGQRFGSHTRDHPDLRNRSVDYLVWQALGGKEAIQEHLGYEPRWVAYPSGSYDAQAIAVFKSAGYWGGLTTRQGATHTSDGLFELHRVRVRGSHTAKDLATLLAIDW